MWDVQYVSVTIINLHCVGFDLHFKFCWAPFGLLGISLEADKYLVFMFHSRSMDFRLVHSHYCSSIKNLLSLPSKPKSISLHILSTHSMSTLSRIPKTLSSGDAKLHHHTSEGILRSHKAIHIRMIYFSSSMANLVLDNNSDARDMRDFGSGL